MTLDQLLAELSEDSLWSLRSVVKAHIDHKSCKRLKPDQLQDFNTLITLRSALDSELNRRSARSDMQRSG